jgi:hypothetical protein
MVISKLVKNLDMQTEKIARTLQNKKRSLIKRVDTPVLTTTQRSLPAVIPYPRVAGPRGELAVVQTPPALCNR